MMFIKTLCLQQMLVHESGQINNVQLITGVRIAEMSQLQNCSVKIFKEHRSRYLTRKRNGGCQLRRIESVWGGGGGGAGQGGGGVEGWICTMN